MKAVDQAGYALGGMTVFNVGMVALSAVVLFGPGRETFRSGFKSAFHGAPNMDVLIRNGAAIQLRRAAIGGGRLPHFSHQYLIRTVYCCRSRRFAFSV